VNDMDIQLAINEIVDDLRYLTGLIYNYSRHIPVHDIEEVKKIREKYFGKG
jgi:hypothetical protein